MLICYFLMMYGLSFCLVQAEGPFRIFDRFRNFCEKHLPSNLSDAYSCMFCTPFQLGVLFSIINIVFLNYNIMMPSYINNCYEYWWLDILIDGSATAAVVYLINTLQEFFESFTDKNNNSLTDTIEDGNDSIE